MFLWSALLYLLFKDIRANILEYPLKESVLDLLKTVKRQNDYSYVLIVDGVPHDGDGGRRRNEACVFHECLGSLEMPAIVMRTDHMEMLETDRRDVVLLSCNYLNYNNDVFYDTDLQMAPHIILAETEAYVSALCGQLVKYEVYNAIVITKDFFRTKSYFVCELKFLIEKEGSSVRRKTFHIQGEKIFEERFFNMKGSKLYTHPDQMLPRSFVFYDRGKLQMDGYVGNILTTFAKRLNAKLAYRMPIEPGVQTFFETLENGTRDGILDIATGLRPVFDNLDNISYPVEFMTYCYMVPLPLRTPVNEIFFMIVETMTMIIIVCLIIIYSILMTWALYRSTEHLTFINVFCNDKSIRGILGQSFVMPHNPRFTLKCICFLICYSSVLLNTSYQAYLQSYLTEPPPQKIIRTYDDMRAAGMKIIASTRELKYLDPFIVEKYDDVFEFYKNYTKYMEIRSKMDTRYVYTVTSAMWYVFYEKQKLFKRPSFYYSSHLCLKDSFLVAIPIRPGLPYREVFNRHLLVLRDVGLMQQWTGNKFFTMLRLKLIDFNDLSSGSDLEMEIVLDDLLWIWILYLSSICVSLIVFSGELIWQRFSSRQGH